MTAAEQLTRALLDLAVKGQRPRCGDPEAHRYWLSEEHEDRKLAATWCAGCPILAACAEAGAAEVFGVWGGVDQTVSTRKGKSSQGASTARPPPSSSATKIPQSSSVKESRP